MRRDIALLCSDLLRCSLFYIVLLVPSASPHIKVILPPNSTSQEVTLIIIHLGYGGYQFKKKTKKFSYYYYYAVIINKYLYFNTNIHHCLQLLYLTLTLLGYCLLLVCSLITG